MKRTPAELISEHMKALGRRGGIARAKAMTPEQRRRSAKKASRAAAEARRQAAGGGVSQERA